MTRFEQEQLIGYLLGALDDDERMHLERRLAAEKELAGRLQAVAEEIRPLRAVAVEHDPPPGLAARTTEFVFDGRPRRAAARRPLSPAAEVPGGWFGRISVADWVVSAALLVAVSVLLLPAIRDSRFNSRLQACQDNLRQLGLAMMQYSEHNGGYLPFVPREGQLATAGIYAPVLSEAGLLPRASTVVCPDSPLAERRSFHIPTLDEVRQTTPVERAAMRSTMGGSYGYSLGHLEGNVYHGTRDLRRPSFAIMADRPDHARPEFRTGNHGGYGQNVLFEDGRVGFLISPASLGSGDRFFLNDEGRVGPGRHRDDSVIVSSTAAPILPSEPIAP